MTKFLSKYGIWILCFALCAAIASLLVIGQYQNQKNIIQTNLNAQTVQVDKFDYSALFEHFDEIAVEQDERGNKNVSTIFNLAGSNLNDVQFTSNESEANVAVTGITTFESNTTYVETNLVLDYGQLQDFIIANGNVYYDENGNLAGTILFDGIEYDVAEVLNAAYGTDGTQECFFWLIIKIVVVVITVISVAKTAVDLYKYVTTEEVTFQGVLCIVVDGMIMAGASAVGGAIVGQMIKAGVKVIKSAKKLPKNKEVLLGRSLQDIDKEYVKLVKSGKTSISHSYSNSTQLRNVYKQKTEFKNFNWTDQSKDDYIQIHHFVEQNQAPIKFAPNTVHTDLNSIGIPKALHQKISGLYSSSTKHKADIDKILGKGVFDGKTTFRDFVSKKSYEEQYEIGVKVFEYYHKTGDYVVLRL